MYPMYPLLNLKTPSFGVRISRVSFRDPGLVLLRAREAPIYHQPGGYFGSGVPPKFIKFQASPQGNKSYENWSQGNQKSWEIDPGIMGNPICAKVDFCNTSLAKCLVFRARTPRFRPKYHQKRQPGNRYKKSMFSVQMYQKSL